MDVRSEILDYINRNETTGALLLTGKWGCGKSYLVRAIAKEQYKSKGAAIAIISLFGVDCVPMIIKRVKEEYFRLSHSLLSRLPKRFTDAIKGAARDGAEIASIAANGNPILSAVSHGLTSVINFEALDLIEVTGFIGKENKAQRFVIVFDDLERSNIEKRDLLGAINEFVESKQIKVIIIADEEKIGDKAYQEYKEKIITRTIRLAPDYEQLIDRIIDSYLETTDGYKAFLKESSAILKQVFSESKSDNLRILKAAITDFERVYEAWTETDIDTSNMCWALYTFTAEVYLSRIPSSDDDAEKHQNRSSLLVLGTKDEQYSQRGKNRSSFSSFTSWIRAGYWDKEAFLAELKMRYGKDESTPVERFLHCQFWDLRQDDIDHGLPVAIHLAYEGQLTRDDLITLLKYIHYLRMHSVKLPCEVDYSRIEDGFKKHIDMIKKGALQDPAHHTFTEDDQIDHEAKSINRLIERSDDVLVAWENRIRFVSFLNSNPTESNYQLRGMYIEEFDTDLLELFIRQYSDASNADKRTMALALLGMSFDSSSCSSEENITRSISNFKRLIEWLKKQKPDDAITDLINRSLVEKIQKIPIMRTIIGEPETEK